MSARGSFKKLGNMKKLTLLIVFTSFFLSKLAWCRDVSILFIGNSYTYLPDLGDPKDPALPQMIQQIAQSIDPHLNITYEFNTPGGYNFERHFNDMRSSMLMSRSYDHVILQGQSIESLELTPWWEQNGNLGVKSFAVFLPKVLELTLRSNSHVTLYVNWGWHPHHPALSVDHPGLVFPPGSKKEGQKWCGENKDQFQDLIDESYLKHSKNYPVVLSKIGRAKLGLERASIISEDEFYLKDDWSHPSVLGAFVTALMLTQDSLGLNISKNKFVPAGVDPEKAIRVQNFLANRK